MGAFEGLALALQIRGFAGTLGAKSLAVLVKLASNLVKPLVKSVSEAGTDRCVGCKYGATMSLSGLMCSGLPVGWGSGQAGQAVPREVAPARPGPGKTETN